MGTNVIFKNGIILIFASICLQSILSNASRSKCPFGPMHRKREPSNKTCSSAKPECSSSSKYRTYDGSCNNLNQTKWGIPDSRYQRLLPAQYGDGIYTPRLAKSGNNLPSAREVSAKLYTNRQVDDGKWTLLNMQFGQFVAHDMSSAKGTISEYDCCSPDGAGDANKRCYPINVPLSDLSYSPINITCLNFLRTSTDKDAECAGKWNVAEQLNDVNAYLDLSPVYGNDNETNAKLRLYSGGLLKFEERNEQHWMPRHPNASSVCFLYSSNDQCYFAGDGRVNQNPELAILHTVFLREHNRIATELSQLNPQWDDERLFQEARKINIGQYQIITYNEWLPIFLGEDLAIEKGITYKNDSDFINDYNESVNVEVLNEHATAAYRFFHTLIEGSLDLSLQNRELNVTARISDWWNNPSLIEDNYGKNIDSLIRGFATQPENAPDEFHPEEITFFWAKNRSATWGQDLKALDIQRDRDHGLESYNAYRELIGLQKAKTFHDLADLITSENIAILESLYESPDDVELTVGGSLETITRGEGLAGQTFKSILAEQFWRTRVGDRFFVENSGITGFSIDQLNELRKATISTILCDNAYNIKEMQPRGFELISNTNELYNCKNLPLVELGLWKENIKA